MIKYSNFESEKLTPMLYRLISYFTLSYDISDALTVTLKLT